MTSKALFQKDEPLRNFWSAVAHHDDFGRVLIFAMNSLIDEPITSEELTGAKRLCQILLNMCDDDGIVVEEPSSGFQHDVFAAVKEKRERDKK